MLHTMMSAGSVPGADTGAGADSMRGADAAAGAGADVGSLAGADAGRRRLDAQCRCRSGRRLAAQCRCRGGRRLPRSGEMDTRCEKLSSFERLRLAYLETAPLCKFANFHRPNRVPRHEQQTSFRVTVSDARMGGECELLLARMRAGGQPYRSSLQSEFATQRGDPCGMVVRQPGVEFHAAECGHLFFAQSECPEAAGVVVVLAGYETNPLEHPARQSPHQAVTPRGALGQAGIGQQYGHAPAMRLGDQVRPQLRFHQHQQAGLRPVEE